MPLPNNAETEWTGYLVEGLSGSAAAVVEHIALEITNRQLPKVDVSPTTVNMWWRDRSPCLDLKSSVDGEVGCTVHVMDYGTALFIGIAYAPMSRLGNYYKRMAAGAFLESIDRSISQALRALSEGEPKGVEVALGKGKFGG